MNFSKPGLLDAERSFIAVVQNCSTTQFLQPLQTPFISLKLFRLIFLLLFLLLMLSEVVLKLGQRGSRGGVTFGSIIFMCAETGTHARRSRVKCLRTSKPPPPPATRPSCVHPHTPPLDHVGLCCCCCGDKHRPAHSHKQLCSGWSARIPTLRFRAAGARLLAGSHP